MKAKYYSGKFLGVLESEIMEIIWRLSDPSSVRDVTENLQKKRKIAYTTVMTIMGRLFEKGLLTRKLIGVSYLYQPKLNREKFVAKTVHNIFATAVSHLGEEVVTYFAKEIHRLHPKKRQKLLKILDDKQHDY